MPTPSLFSAADRDAILDRLTRLRPDAERQWGKMSVGAMLAHCQMPLRVAVGDLELKRSLIGLLFGRMAKKKLLAPAPWKPDMPTAPEFKVQPKGDFETERRALATLVRRFGEAGPEGAPKKPHPFFGPLMPQEWDALQWKHLDHHLRQFGA